MLDSSLPRMVLNRTLRTKYLNIALVLTSLILIPSSTIPVLTCQTCVMVESNRKVELGLAPLYVNFP